MKEDNENLDKTGVQITLPVLNWKCFFFGLIIGLLFAFHWSGCSCHGAEAARNLEDIHAASCRVFAMDTNGRGAIGTGTICGLFNDKYYILTNWHVVESYRQVTLQFFGTGRITECKGTVIATWHNETQPYDFAIVTVEQRQLAQYNPPFVPLAQRGTRPKTGGLIFSSGCSEGRWPFAWKGSVESYYGETAQFFPAPKGGQSGSAIVEEIDGELRITGILTWRVGDEKKLSEEEMRGGAIPISKLYEAFDGKHKTGLPNSVPPNAVWCKTGSADVSSAPNETGVSPDSSSKNETTAVEEEPKDEAIKKIEPKETHEKEKDFAIHRIEPKTPETKTLPKEIPNERVQIHAIGNTDDYKTPVSQKILVEVIFFTSTYCIPCKQAEPIVAEMSKKGYTIHTIKIDDDNGRKLAFERQVTSTPTFVVYRSEDNRATWSEISRFSGTANLKERLLQSFSLGNSGGSSQREEPLEIRPDKENLSPLFNEYGSGWRGRGREKPDETIPDLGSGESGLFRSTDSGLLKLFKNFMTAVILRAAVMIAVFWYVMYGLLRFGQSLIGCLPKISLQFKQKSTSNKNSECE